MAASLEDGAHAQPAQALCRAKDAQIRIMRCDARTSSLLASRQAAMCKVFVGLRSGAVRWVDEILESEDVHLWSHCWNSFGPALSDVFGTI